MQILNMPALIRMELEDEGPMSASALAESKCFTNRAIIAQQLDDAVAWMIGNELLEVRGKRKLFPVQPLQVPSVLTLEQLSDHVLDLMACSCRYIEGNEIDALVHQQGITIAGDALVTNVGVLNALDRLRRRKQALPQSAMVQFVFNFSADGLPSGYSEVVEAHLGAGSWFVTIAGLQARLMYRNRRKEEINA